MVAGADAGVSIAAVTVACDLARTRWPGMTAEPSDLIDAMRSAGVDDGRLATRGEELVMAHAAALGDDVATRAFDRELVGGTRTIIQRYTRDTARTEEVLQRLRIHLLLAEGTGPCRLARFDGRAALAAWVGICAARLALYILRGERNQREVAVEWSDALVEVPVHDPRIAAVLEGQASRVGDALRDACESLSRRHRGMLRLLFVEGASVDEIAAVYQVHRVTAWRWIQDARTLLRQRVAERLGPLGEGAASTSLMEWLGERVDLSLAVVLAPTATDVRP